MDCTKRPTPRTSQQARRGSGQEKKKIVEASHASPHLHPGETHPKELIPALMPCVGIVRSGNIALFEDALVRLCFSPLHGGHAQAPSPIITLTTRNLTLENSMKGLGKSDELVFCC